MVIDARTNLLATDLRGVTFTVGAPNTIEQSEPTAATRNYEAGGFVGTLVVVPESGNDAALSVRLVAGVRQETSSCRAPAYDGCIVARRSLRYRPHVRLVLPIMMTADCTNVPCDGVTTCLHGVCVDAAVDPDSCSDGTPCLLAGERNPQLLPDASSRDAPSTDGPKDPDATNDGASDGGTDAADASEGRSIKCPPSGPCTGTDVCCIQTGSQGQCQPVGSTCMPPTVRITCDGREDCAAGQQCCAVNAQTQCTGPCMAGTEVCKLDSDCHRAGELCSGSFAGYGVCK